jgi:hypothetical protein
MKATPRRKSLLRGNQIRLGCYPHRSSGRPLQQRPQILSGKARIARRPVLRSPRDHDLPAIHTTPRPKVDRVIRMLARRHAPGMPFARIDPVQIMLD